MLKSCPNNLILNKKRMVCLALCSAITLPQGISAQSTADENANALSEVVVSATRSETPVSQLTRSVTVIDREEIESQASLDQDLGSILAQTVPGMSPSTEALSNFGQSLRGRNFLVLIDGIPQSTPLRDGFRDLNTINPAAIERIEVVRGGTAAYGFGAAGGLVNIITKKPSEEKFSARSEAGMSFSTEHFDDSGEYTTNHRVSGTQGDINYLAAGQFTTRNGRFDSEGRRIPPDPLASQGGLADTDEYNLLGKAGYSFDEKRQRIDVMVNHYNIEQESDYVGGFFFSSPSFSTLNSDPLPGESRTPAIQTSSANPGSTNTVKPGTENTAANMNYNHTDLLGSRVDFKTYYGDQTAVFAKFPGSPQSKIISEKYGNRLTIDTPFNLYDSKASIIWGMDYVHDETSQVTFGQNTVSDPLNLEQDAIAGFAEIEIPVNDIGLIRGGVRHEEISVDVDTLVNQSGNRIQGGSIDYGETLFNASGVLYVNDSMELFAGFSQGFSLSDIGRVISDDINNSRAEQFEDDAEKVDNYEVGMRGRYGATQFTVAGFYSKSDNGTTFGPAPDLLILKNEEEIWGIEAALDYRFDRQWQVGGTFTWSEGDTTDPARGEEELPNTRISPEKLTAYLEYTPNQHWQNRLQVQYVGDRTTDSTAFGSGSIDSYTLVDVMSRVAVGPGHLRLALENLLNRDYYPAINQAYNAPYAYAKGPGRRVGLSYAVNW